MNLKKALNERLNKAKYIKRWKGKDGRYHYQYKPRSKRTATRKKQQQLAFEAKIKDLERFRNIHDPAYRAQLKERPSKASTYLEDTIGYTRNEFTDAGMKFTDRKWNTLSQTIEKFDKLVQDHPRYEMIMPEDIFYDITDFVDSWDNISANLDVIDSESPSRKTDKLIALVADIKDLLKEGSL